MAGNADFQTEGWNCHLFLFLLVVLFCRVSLLTRAFHSLDKMDRIIISANQLQVFRLRHFLLNGQWLRLLSTNNSNLCRFQLHSHHHTHPRYCQSVLSLSLLWVIMSQQCFILPCLNFLLSAIWFFCFLLFSFPFSFLHSIPQSRWWQLWQTVNPPTLSLALLLSLQFLLHLITFSSLLAL